MRVSTETLISKNIYCRTGNFPDQPSLQLNPQINNPQEDYLIMARALNNDHTPKSPENNRLSVERVRKVLAILSTLLVGANAAVELWQKLEMDNSIDRLSVTLPAIEQIKTGL